VALLSKTLNVSKRQSMVEMAGTSPAFARIKIKSFYLYSSIDFLIDGKIEQISQQSQSDLLWLFRSDDRLIIFPLIMRQIF